MAMSTGGRRVRLSSKGQLVIPQEVREHLGLEAGDELVLHEVSDRVLVLEKPEPTAFERALARIQEEAAARGITRDDVEAALDEVKREMYAETYGEVADAPAVR
jgi:antitoxin PrlF